VGPGKEGINTVIDPSPSLVARINGTWIMVSLSKADVVRAEQVGRDRHQAALRDGHRDANGLRADYAQGLELHLNGACGELAFAHAINVPWEATVDTYKRVPDVAGYEVRTRSKPWWDLIIRTDDRIEAKFALVLGQRPNFRIAGWIHARDGRRPEWYRDRGERGSPCWWVPQRALHPFVI
jgi:hypothetical protein